MLKGLTGSIANITGGTIVDLTSLSLTTGAILSGTYTPTLTNGANVAASTAFVCQYLRVGAVVTVSGRVDIDPTASSQTVLGISLPIASAFSGLTQLGGTAACPDVAGYSASISADATNDRAQLVYICGADVANRVWSFTFTYLIL